VPEPEHTSQRDRDASGRPRSARPRDALGRPLPYGTPGVADDPELLALETADPQRLLAAAQELLDAGRPFEAHELLEAGWKRAPDPERPLWRALAQLAVGMTHRGRGNETGAQALFLRSADALEGVGAAPQPHGIAAAGLAQAARSLAAGKSVRLQLREGG
jgi:predicted metal-dependent hydrolase